MQLPELSFSKFTLDNGLDVIFRRQPQLPIVAVNLWYHVGSKNEERNQRGFAHLFEHLMFEGSEHYPGDFFKHLQRFGANINGSTSSDRTNYFVDIPTSYLETVLAMESDRMANLVPALDDSKLRIQKGVVKNEYRQNYANRPYGMVWPLLAEALFPPQHPYSWLTIGVMEDLDTASLEDVSAFFRRFYVPANASLTLVGDLEVEATLAQIERYFGGIGGGTKALRPWAPVATISENRDLTFQDRVELDRLYRVWHTVPQFHDDDAPLHLLSDILARGKASRLYQKLVMDRQIAQDVSAFQSSRELGGSFGMTVTLRPGRDLAEAGDMLEEELQEIAASGVTEEELDRVLTMTTASFIFALEHIGGFGGVADRLNAYNVYRGDPGLITSDLERYRRVTPAMIQQVARTYLAGRPRVSLAVRGRKSTISLPLDRKVPPQSALSSAYRPPLPIVRNLSNGIPVWVLPQQGLPTVTLGVAMIGGATLQPAARPGLAQLALSMLDEGTKHRSSSQIALAAEAMGTHLSTHCGWDGAFVTFRCLLSKLEPSLDLALELLREPSFPEAEWQRVQAQTVASLRADRDSADSRAHAALLKALYEEGHPYRFPLDGDEKIVADIARGEAIDFHARFLGPARAGIVVAGAIDPDAIVQMLEARLSDWSGPAVEIPAVPTPVRATTPRILLLDRPGSPQAVVRVGHVGIPRKDVDFESAMLVNQVLGGQFSSRLNEKLREERGFTYGVRSHFDGRRGAGPFSIAASLQSDRLSEAMEDLRHELVSIVEDRPAKQSEIDDARRALIEAQSRQFETPAALVNRYISVMIHGLGIDHLATFPERLSAIDLDTVNSAAQRHIVPDSMVAIIVADVAEVGESLRGLDWARVEQVAD